MSREDGRLRVAFAAFALLLSQISEATAGDWIADGKTGCKVWNPQPVRDETVSWTGGCKGGLAEGKGVLDWLRGGKPYERDEGEWRTGRQTGEGSQVWPGGHYRGEIFDGLPQGRGALAVGQSSYEGAFLNGKPNGRGTLTNGRHIRWPLAGWLFQRRQTPRRA